jgi:hypothetical protein
LKEPKIAVALLVVGLAIGLSQHAAAGATAAGVGSENCTTSVSGTVTTNVTVPAGAACAFDSHAVVNGNVSVGPGATLIVADGVTINGNLEASQGAGVLMGLSGTTLNGNYSATGAVSTMLKPTLKRNVTLNGGYYGIIAVLVGRISCTGGVTGATTAAGGNTNGCTGGTLATVLPDVLTAADKASGTSGSGGSNKGLTCDQAQDLASFYNTLADLFASVGNTDGAVAAGTIASNIIIDADQSGACGGAPE